MPLARGGPRGSPLGPALVAALLLCACGRAAAPPDPHALLQGALAQQYFDAHRALPGDAEETQLGQEATGLLTSVYALPAPARSSQALPIAVSSIEQADGDTAVQEALLAAYVLHFGAVPSDPARSAIQNLAGSGGEAPIPVIGLKQPQ